MTTSQKTLIKAQDLHKNYKIGKNTINVLRGVNMEVFNGEKIFLCGPSGAGKTTLMYTLAGLEKPDKGEVIFENQNIFKLSKSAQAKLRNKNISYIFQNYYLLPELTALENVCIPSLIGKKYNHDAALSALKRVGLEHRVNHLPAELSGGEQQRVSIARAILNEPKIIFADEPTGNLDSKNGSDVMQLLLELSNQDGTTLVVVTHDTSLAHYGDRTLIVKDGCIAE